MAAPAFIRRPKRRRSLSPARHETAAGGTPAQLPGYLHSQYNKNKKEDGAEAMFAPGSGMPMAEGMRRSLEGRMGIDLSAVRIHNDLSAQSLSRVLNARAFTYKNHIVLGAGQDQFDRGLIVHEATHVSQQGYAPAHTTLPKGISAAHAGSLAEGFKGGDTPTVQRRPMTDQESYATGRLETFATAVENENKDDEGLPGDIRSVKSSVEGEVASVPEITQEVMGYKFRLLNDPKHLMSTLWSLHTWATTPSTYTKSRGIVSDLPVRDVDSGSYKCNRFVGDAFAVGARLGYAEEGMGGAYPKGSDRYIFWNGYPPSANELADPDKRLNNLIPVGKKHAQMGYIVAFANNSGMGHTGINLGHGLYISARNSVDRPAPSMQVSDGVQITRLPAGLMAKYRKFSYGFPFDFSIKARLPESRKFYVSNGKVTVDSFADYEDDIRKMPVKPGNHYYIKLHRSIDWWPDEGYTSAKYTTGRDQTYTWTGLESGNYYMEIWKHEPSGFSPFYLDGKGEVKL